MTRRVESVAKVAVPAMNLADAFFTMFWLLTGEALEANPLMAAAWKLSPIAFVSIKVLMVNVGMEVLLRHGGHKLARVAMVVALTVYAMVVAYHLLYASLM